VEEHFSVEKKENTLCTMCGQEQKKEKAY